jgi:hypothetical protein
LYTEPAGDFLVERLDLIAGEQRPADNIQRCAAAHSKYAAAKEMPASLAS